MDIGIHCEIGFKGSVLRLSEQEFEERIALLLPQITSMCTQQRKAYNAQVVAAQAKGPDLQLPFKTINVTGSIGKTATVAEKGASDSEDKGCSLVFDMKSFALALPDAEFENYLKGCHIVIKDAIVQQRKAYLEIDMHKSMDDEKLKGISLVCDLKSMCA